jgi:hypothetical protein
MIRGRIQAALALGAFGLTAWAATPARAQTAGIADEHAAAATLVGQLEHDAAHAPVLAEALAKAKNALERATRLRSAGDETHAKAADGLALEWAQTGRDLARAADAETTAGDLRRKAVDAQDQLERTRTLVEEGLARVGRLKAELDAATHTSKEDRTAVEVHAGEPLPKKKAANKPSPTPTPTPTPTPSPTRAPTPSPTPGPGARP